MSRLHLHLTTFIKYCCVGALGTVLDIGALFILVEYFHLPILTAAVISFIIAVTNNFILNKVWTFENTSTTYRKLYVKFLMISGIGLGLTIVSMNILVNLIGVWYILSKAITSVLVLTWNFLGNKFWTFKNVHRIVHIPTHYNLKFSIVIPAYNEAQRIGSTLVAIDAFLKKTGVGAEIIVVNDGSTDTTVDTVRSYQKSMPNLSLVDYGSNEGKGFAIKSGIVQSKGEYILFTDADNSTPIEELSALHRELENGEFDVAIGSRFLPQSNIMIKQSTYRVALGRIGNLLIRAFLLSNIRDTQCGFKLFTHEAAQHIFDLQKVRRFGFDMEALVIGKNLGYKIKEVPVSWLNSTDSRVRPIRDAVRTLIELMYIKFNLLSGRYDTEKN